MARNDLKNVRQRRFLGRDFDGFRNQLLEYARLHYSDRLKDFSEASMGGLLLDFAAGVGDNLSFYLDHLQGELDPSTAVEPINIERHLNSAGVPIVGASPAIVPSTIFLQVPAETVGNSIRPMIAALPIVQMNSVFESNNGTSFILVEDIDFSSTDENDALVAEVRVAQKNSSNVPTSFIIAASGFCVSGQETTETIPIGSTFIPFKQITLANSDVSEIISVYDGYGNVYYNVNSLTNDVVYRNVLNTAIDNDLVRDGLKVIPAPYRFTTRVDLKTRRTTMVLGGGNADTLEDDVIPDPSEFAISFPYSRTFSRTTVNPNQLLQTRTLGVYAVDTTLTVVYRHGGGLNHNVASNTLKNVISLRMTFPGNPSATIAGSVRSSIEITNRLEASGGDDAPTSQELVEQLPAIRNAQERIVTREDLLARVYTIPANFGRVFRAAVRSNPVNPLATQLFIVSRNIDQRLITSPDTLKRNLIKYLNPYRSISDAIDILDAYIVNLKLTFDILIDPSLNRSVVIQGILTKLQRVMSISNFNIDQPIVLSDINNLIFSTSGVLSVNSLTFENIAGIVTGRTYSDTSFNVTTSTKHGIIFPPPGGIFEIRYPEFDIVGRASV